MITITKKDNATIIVIENPTNSEADIIEKAEKVVNSNNSSFWTKNDEIRNGKKNSPKSEKEDMAKVLGNLDDFEVIIDQDELPF